MITTKPLFEVGEVVVRQAPQRNYPEWNGEYTVTGIITSDEYLFLYPLMGINIGWYYELDGLNIFLPWTEQVCHHSSERFLRKKHQPGEYAFMSLVAHLKSNQPVSREVFV